MGLDFTLVIPFDRDFAGTEPEDFVERILVRGLHTAHIVVGPDCRFGKKARGDAHLLRAIGETAGFSVDEVPPQFEGETRISSTAIRSALTEGRVADAATMLGRPHLLRGTVVPGEQRGRHLGFPTANLGRREAFMLPRSGVYAGRVTGSGLESHPCVLNVGKNPTFGGTEDKVEVHLLDFSGDLYGAQLEVSLEHFIREEMRFDGLENLVEQIRKDAAHAAEWLD